MTRIDTETKRRVIEEMVSDCVEKIARPDQVICHVLLEVEGNDIDITINPLAPDYLNKGAFLDGIRGYARHLSYATGRSVRVNYYHDLETYSIVGTNGNSTQNA